ncbi:MAG: UDP-N-acetylmuramoyl-L-alanine--D-glutamate ligase [Candidatus Margulisbacteria bacterium]|nr:UDP-N-acetylmuramoyl-L-alanine--D-glutamate ligase [Candidatus Margulisiibacteriota bacterium]MBU1616846.1 UDP-N-acetylmuramoyl-L-alanine--D-glutamate ligase [Candidatus Margulisiibacteriota bacterium]MBU1867639.1 UDP-N-acetylmuramoyl-L-alanine--D-glutamate ligase [Candidatus Margulisiibacteriota bacterium]
MNGKKVIVVGLGKSGFSAAIKLAGLGAVVTATDQKGESLFSKELLGLLTGKGIKLALGGNPPELAAGADLVVVSPGIHLDIPILASARQKNIPIISEVELAFRFLTKPVIAITGTNGKTTTTTLIGEMLKAGGKRLAVAGNIGLPLIEVDDSSLDYVVAEISSYQLEAIVDFKPFISVILNIQPDHLERHHTLAEYIAQKQRIFANQTGDDYLVYNADDPQVVKMAQEAKAQLVPFAKEEAARIISLVPEEIRIPGRHNLENALAAASVAALCGIKKEKVAKVLKTFPGVEHRIEFVQKKKGIGFYNDSKGTNPDSTIVAIETFKGKGLVLILGGRDKGVDLDEMVKRIKDNVKAVVLIGEAADRFETALRKAGYDQIFRAGFSMGDAVREAYRLAEKGDIVLLSPACASFDMFSNYEERGRIFKELCLSLK